MFQRQRKQNADQCVLGVFRTTEFYTGSRRGYHEGRSTVSQRGPTPPRNQPMPAFYLTSPRLRNFAAFSVLLVIVSLADQSVCWAADESSYDKLSHDKAEHLEFFEKQIRPLLVRRCYECHAGDERSGGLLLDSRDGLMRGGDSGASVVVGKPENSLLVEAVLYKNEDLQMPPDGKLPDADIAILQRWVKLGLPDPRKAKASVTSEPTGMSIQEGRKFWAFRPVTNPAIPDVDSDWIQTPIDAFVLSKLSSAGLTPAPKADRRTLIRRITFDLIGLPPTPAEVDAFLADESPNAISDLVERLLASPHYGERWGRHWLDVARYADSNGLDENLAFGTAWRYRDYVVQSFNNDKPFNRFLIEQVAGDLLPTANRETKTATAFLALGAKVLAEPDREKLTMDTIDEQLDTIGKAFMGMTLGCVRCHDHKFDPIKQTDYYALAAIFKSTKTFGDTKTGAIKHWHEHSFTSDQQADAVEKADALIAQKKKAATTFKNATIAAIRADAQSKAAEYLAAAARFDPSATLNEVAAFAQPSGLHPRILHHCRLHLQYHRSDVVFGKWHELASQGSDAVRDHYGPLFQKVQTEFDAAKKQDQATKKLSDAKLEAVRIALNDKSGFLAIPPKPEFAFDQDQLAEYYELMEAARLVESSAPDGDTVMGVAEATTLVHLPIHIRGSHRNMGDPVAREFPEVMRVSSARPIFPTNQSGRLQLANWMASTQHPLTARVYANRIWRWHFGRGIVGTTDNFGKLGDRPSHPELLDWLARYLMQSGWSTKSMHRLIVSSSTYQMASSADLLNGADPVNGNEVDVENRLLWKFPMQRLEAEQIRDSILFVSQRLDKTMQGKTVPLRNRQFVFNHTSVDHTKYDSLRRAIYLPVIRNNLYTLFSQFDFPDPTMPTGSRSSTIVAPQALLMMNSGLVIDSANSLAKTIVSEARGSDRVDLAYQKAFGRKATDAEKSRAIAFVNRLTQRSQTDAEVQAWALFCQSLFASNEFVFIR